MKYRINIAIVTAVVLCAIAGAGITWHIYSRHAHHVSTAPLLLPPVEMWPSNILAAAEILRTSEANRARDKAGFEIEKFTTGCMSIRDASEKSHWQPLHEETILKLFGPPRRGPTDNYRYLTYDLGHYSGTHQSLEFLMSSSIVTKVILSHWDGPICTIHDHTNDNAEQNQEAEQAVPGYPPQGVGSPEP